LAEHRRHLRNYILDKGLQLRYLAVVVAVSALIAGGLGFLLNRQETGASADIVASMKDPQVVEFLGAEGVKQVQASLAAQDTSQLAIMLVVGLGLMVVLSGYLVLMTHKVAGPLFKISAYFDRITEGKLPKVYDLRKGDQLVDFFEKFKAMDEALRERTEQEIVVLERVLAAAGSAGPGAVGHRLEELARLIAEKKASLV
jgi:methyl-accepting chemotaxis protein